MALVISALQISQSKNEEQQFQRESYTKVPGNLNTGTTGPEEYLWYKKENNPAITRIQFSFMEEMKSVLSEDGFTQIDKNINRGTTGDIINLWYKKGSTEFDVPITDLKVTTQVEDEPELFGSEWKRLGCDLNRSNSGAPVYVWVKRSKPTYISNIAATVRFSSKETELTEKGSYRVDEDTNRGANPGSRAFLWYCHSINSANSVSEIAVSVNGHEENELKGDGFTKLEGNLNDGTTGFPVYLWYKKGKTPPLQYFTVLVGKEALDVYKKQSCRVVEKNLNEGNNGRPLYLAYK